MLGRVYSITFNGVAVTAQQDFFEINVASTKVVRIHSLHLSQETNVSDANEKELRVAVKSGQTTSGSGGSAPTAIPREGGDAAYAGTVEVNNTTKATAGTIVTHSIRTWNIRVPLDVYWPPDQRIALAPSVRATVELLTTPAASTTMSGELVIEEVG
jgi:hypothetical protein